MGSLIAGKTVQNGPQFDSGSGFTVIADRLNHSSLRNSNNVVARITWSIRATTGVRTPYGK
ncbi:hypothetical protein [Leucobacter sp. 1207-22]|uniref:hypothetical protein n=1 Tax=Leucobacter sp. 1207-22 TaxID=2604456 RepID=UPI004062A75B